MGEESASTSMSVRDFADDACSLSVVDFEERHGSAFLLVSEAELSAPTLARATVVDGLPADPAASKTSRVSLAVHPVARSGRSVVPFITVGRTSNNDVVINDSSVSRFHAFLKEAENGGFEILDADSSNGTAVNGARVPKQGAGSPVALKAGDNVRVGAVEMTFLDANALRNLASKVKRRSGS